MRGTAEMLSRTYYSPGVREAQGGGCWEEGQVLACSRVPGSAKVLGKAGGQHLYDSAASLPPALSSVFIYSSTFVPTFFITSPSFAFH